MEICYQDECGEVRTVNENWIRLSGLPEETYRTMRMHTLEPRQDVKGTLEAAIRSVADLVEGRMECPMVLLCSGPGMGKTHLAIAAGWMMLSRGKSVAFWPTVKLLDALKDGYEQSQKPRDYRNGRTYENIMTWLQHVQLLILDDIGMENRTGWSVEKLDQIVDHRYLYKLPTLLTSNDLDFSARIVSRCKEGAIVLMTGTDYRGRKDAKSVAKQPKNAS